MMLGQEVIKFAISHWKNFVIEEMNNVIYDGKER